jgi:hypothetical protein
MPIVGAVGPAYTVTLGSGTLPVHAKGMGPMRMRCLLGGRFPEQIPLDDLAGVGEATTAGRRLRCGLDRSAASNSLSRAYR